MVVFIEQQKERAVTSQEMYTIKFRLKQINWKDKIVLVLDSSEYITNLSDIDILEINIKCYICKTKLWNDM